MHSYALYYTFAGVNILQQKISSLNLLTNMKTLIKPCLVTLLLSFIFITFTSCLPTRENALNQFREVCHDIILNGETCNDAEWDEYQAQLELAVSELEKYEGQFTEDELNEIGRLEGKVTKIIIKREGVDYLKEFIESIKGAAAEGLGILDGILS